MWKKILLVYIIGFCLGDTDRAFNYKGFTGTSGEIQMTQAGSLMFFWQFDALGGNITTDTRPLIIWTQGGPGCASELGLFGEGIAPFFIDNTGSPQPNPATWALKAHILAIDFPYDSGYSYAAQPEDFMNTTLAAVEYLYDFLQILASKYPTWFNRDIFWFGEDYSGHFIPAIAGLILHNNQYKNETYINLKGIALGNPWSDGLYQTQYYDSFAYNLGLINKKQKAVLMNGEALIKNYILSGDYSMAFSTWQMNYGQFELFTDSVNVYNMRSYSIPTFSSIYGFLNSPAVKKTFGMNLASTWTACNQLVFDEFSTDFMLGFVTTMMPSLLSNLKVMIYHGQDDLFCTTDGLNAWIQSISWTGMNQFLNSRRGAWLVEGNIAGYAQVASNLTYVQVLNAGAMVGAAQPQAFRDLAYRFIFNQGWN